MHAAPLVSVVIPLRSEALNIAPLIAEISVALSGTPHEIICVDDGATDMTPQVLAAVTRDGAPLRWLRHRASCGQSAAIMTGVGEARGEWIATLDGDGQNDPSDIPRLLARATAIRRAAGGAPDGPVMVVGHRTGRKVGWHKRFSSRLANHVGDWLLRDATPDRGCGLKVFPRRTFQAFPHFDHMHRFLPALAVRAGATVLSEPVNHRPRLHGRSNYGRLDRLSASILDVVGVAWLLRRGRRPKVEYPEAEGA